MKSSKDIFNKEIQKSFSQIKLNPDTMKDLLNYKNEFREEKLSNNVTFNDLVKKNLKKGVDPSDVEKKIKKQLSKGIKVEMEHTSNKNIAKKIAMDHLIEDINYYIKLEKIESKEATGTGSSGAYSSPLFSGEEPKKVEAKEATTSGSVGAYETPAAWAKSTRKKHWRGASKTQIPGGSFVTVKKKCSTFPYCNQGDIKSLKLTKGNLKEAIYKVSQKFGITEEEVRSILINELKNTMP